MELRDFIVTPIVLILVYLVAYWVRPRFTDINTKRYFIPALTVRVIGAIAVGFIYQFYYDGGDTFTYHTRGSAVIWEAFMEAPINGLKLIFAGKEPILELYKYTHRMWFYGDMSSYFVIRIAAIFDLLTFRTYSSTAVLFACMSFIGAWTMFQVFYSRFRTLHMYLAMAILFVPSVFFWGSGIFKDTITLAALGGATYCFDQIYFKKNRIITNSLLLFLFCLVIFSVKKYILLCFAPALIMWVYMTNVTSIRSLILRLFLIPFIFTGCIALAYWAVVKVGEGDPRYAIENIAQTAQTTAYDIAFWTGKNAGSTYTLGELDGTFESMFQLLPNAINVSLFRPYLWEIKNPLMFLAGLESFCVLLLTLWTIYRTKLIGVFRINQRPIVFFCLTFSLVFAFAVGVSTYNFGTLMRYKIPLMPFYLSALIILNSYSKRERKFL